MLNLTVIFNSLPFSELSHNSRIDWRKRASLVKQEREYARLIGIQNKGDRQAPKRAVLYFEFYVSSKRLHDLDNLISSCKAWIDGLKDSGILSSDDCWHLSYGYAKVILAKHDETRLIIQGIENETH